MTRRAPTPEQEERRKVIAGVIALVLASPFLAILAWLLWEAVTA